MNPEETEHAVKPFGIRYKYAYPDEDELEEKYMDGKLKNQLWDVIYEYWPYSKETRRNIWSEWIEDTLDELDALEERDESDSMKPKKSYGPEYRRAFNIVKDEYKKRTYGGGYMVYELIEIVCNDQTIDKEKFEESINSALRRNLATWELVEGRLRPTMSKEEKEGIRQAQNISGRNDEYIKKAIMHMSPSRPDYESSIAESVKMVEYTAKKVGGEGKGLNGLVNDIDRKARLHPSMKELFRNMYGFANSASRHAEQEPYEPDVNDARVVLVWCSAMANYLVGRAGGDGAQEPDQAG